MDPRRSGPESPVSPVRSVPVWSVEVQNAGTGEVLLEREPGQVLRTASIGKILLLIHIAELVGNGQLDLGETLTRTAQETVADSGVWQYLTTDSLPVGDLCELVGMASDNLATNVLLARVGLDRVAETADRLGLRDTALHDRVRDVRTPADPVTLSSGSAAELTGLMVRLYREAAVGDPVGLLVLGWLAKGMDLSQVASGWQLDPLAHLHLDRGLTVFNKTGTDTDVRAEVGLLTGQEMTLAYAVIANWSDQQNDRRDQVRGEVLAEQRRLGRWMARLASGE